ncbi:MAG: hypothetical protein AB7S26_21500 [Sandaracinaceae bacterium]
MATERWLTLPEREGIRSPELIMLLQDHGRDYARVWDACEDPKFLIELAAAGGVPVDMVLGACAKCCAEAWSHWSGGATDPRPLQIVNAITRWLNRDSGFEDIWATWELAEHVHTEVRAWYATQSGAMIATAILNAVDAVHALSTAARDLAEPEEGHDQHDAARYREKNADKANHGLVHDAARSVLLAKNAGAFWHSHSEPSASQAAHDGYANQILGFVIRQGLDADRVVSGLRERVR